MDICKCGHEDHEHAVSCPAGRLTIAECLQPSLSDETQACECRLFVMGRENPWKLYQASPEWKPESERFK
jgi:hypothetical protein